MKKLFLIYVLCLIFCTSCTKEGKEVPVQEIKTFGDCEKCENWTWSVDGTGNSVGDKEGTFTIRAAYTGEMSMRYCLGLVVDTYLGRVYNPGVLSISGGVDFNVAAQTYPQFHNYKTLVRKGSDITFRGIYARIIDLKIVADSKDDAGDDF